MRKILIVLLSVLLKFNGLAQVYPLNNFQPVSLPETYSQEWAKLKLSYYPQFVVSIVKGRLQISKAIDILQSYGMVPYNLPKGNLLAINAGEWGGSLLYQPNDTTLKYFRVNGKPDTVNNKYASFKNFVSKLPKVQQLFKGDRLLLQYGNFAHLFSYQNNVYAVEHRQNMYSYYGVFYRIDVLKDGFNIKKVLDFNEDSLAKAHLLTTKEAGTFDYWDTPAGVFTYKDRIFLTTMQRFYIIKNWHKELVFHNLFWENLNPSSFALLGHNLFIGMHGGYAKIDLNKKGYRFL